MSYQTLPVWVPIWAKDSGALIGSRSFAKTEKEARELGIMPSTDYDICLPYDPETFESQTADLEERGWTVSHSYNYKNGVKENPSITPNNKESASHNDPLLVAVAQKEVGGVSVDLIFKEEFDFFLSVWNSIGYGFYRNHVWKRSKILTDIYKDNKVALRVHIMNVFDQLYGTALSTHGISEQDIHAWLENGGKIPW